MEQVIEKIGIKAIGLGVNKPLTNEEYKEQVRIVEENRKNPQRMLELLGIVRG